MADASVSEKKRFRHGAKPVIGLIGAIGAGKSTVAQILAVHGGWVIDADSIGHSALDQPGIREKIIERWGKMHGNILKADGGIDRRGLAEIVFSHPDERLALESMVFPYIGKQTLDLMQEAQDNPNVTFIAIDAAVMLEAGWKDVCDEILFVDAPREQRLERVAVRGWTARDLSERESAQWPIARKRGLASNIIMNDAGIDSLREQVQNIIGAWNFAGQSSEKSVKT